MRWMNAGTVSHKHHKLKWIGSYFCQFKIKIGELQYVLCDTCPNHHSLTYTILHTPTHILVNITWTLVHLSSQARRLFWNNKYIIKYLHNYFLCKKDRQCGNVSMPWRLHATWAPSQYKNRLICVWRFYMLKIRRPLGRLIFNMGIAIPGKTVFLIETAPSKMKDLHLLEISVCKYEHQNYILCVLPAMYKSMYFHLLCCCNSSIKFILYFSYDTMKTNRKFLNLLIISCVFFSSSDWLNGWPRRYHAQSPQYGPLWI